MADIQEIVEDLEKKNVDIMATLLDSQFEDVRISKYVCKGGMGEID